MKPQIHKVRNLLRALAWVAWHCKEGKDADDYFQTLSVAHSLLQSNGFKHQNLLQHYRSPRNQQVGGGIQFTKMLESKDENFQASGGITSGAAMKVAPLAIFYRNNFQAFIENTLKVTNILHNSTEAKLSAILLGLHFWQIFQENRKNSPENLFKLWQNISQNNFDKISFLFFEKVLKRALELSQSQKKKPLKLLKNLVQEVGITHFAWSTPVAACFWAFSKPELSYELLEPKLYPFKKKTTILNPQIKNEYQTHLEKINEHQDYFKRYGERWEGEENVDADIDTFWSISFSLIAAQNGLGQLKEEAKEAEKLWGDNLSQLAEDLWNFSEK